MKRTLLYLFFVAALAALSACQTCPNPDPKFVINSLKIVPYRLDSVGSFHQYTTVDTLTDGVNFLIEPVTEDVAQASPRCFRLFPSAFAACVTEGVCTNQIIADSSSLTFDSDLIFAASGYPQYAGDTIFAGTNLLKDPRIKVDEDICPFPTKFRKGKYEVKINHQHIYFPEKRYNVTFRFVTTKKTQLVETISVYIDVY